DLNAAGAFFPPTLLFCPQPDETPAVHATEAFGPVATLMPYQSREHAMALARAGEGSLAGTLVTADLRLARQFIAGAARAHGRIQILNEESAKESTGHGSPLPQLVHGG
ncbi:MAG TPA: phenylacetic acid degradation bifunctional protein PaaZ, partial [Leclercia adecarboxylata]|nr:phenylacetic acid degradation bifunctional protein PaaZ [Leclercia adecarboxylata]